MGGSFPCQQEPEELNAAVPLPRAAGEAPEGPGQPEGLGRPRSAPGVSLAASIINQAEARSPLCKQCRKSPKHKQNTNPKVSTPQ